MQFTSTRSKTKTTAARAILAGIAQDGGLFVTRQLENSGFDVNHCLSLSTQEMSAYILSFILGPEFTDMKELVRTSYENKFQTEDLTPLVKVGDTYVLELFHGPTCAFKDVALSVLPLLITKSNEILKNKRKTVVLTATSGDTGKAALEGFHDVPGTEIFVFYPHNGVSAIQKAQMVTQQGNNVHVCAVRGNFDDCQSAVKNAFSKLAETMEKNNAVLSSANSINIGRLVPQIVYYFAAYRDLLKQNAIQPGEKADFFVPTGNFGDILAGFYAKLLGLPVGKLICASNSNNVLTDFLKTGTYNANRPFLKTISPSMDILISSNLERLLYIASGNNEEEVRSYMEDLKKNRCFTVKKETMDYIKQTFEGTFCTEEEVKKTIGKVYEKYRYLCDPHTAVAFGSALKYKSNENNPRVVLSTANPYKFPACVLDAIGEKVPEDEFQMLDRLHEVTHLPVPDNLANLKGCKVIHPDVINKEEIISYIEKGVNK